MEKGKEKDKLLNTYRLVVIAWWVVVILLTIFLNTICGDAETTQKSLVIVLIGIAINVPILLWVEKE